MEGYPEDVGADLILPLIIGAVLAAGGPAATETPKDYMISIARSTARSSLGAIRSNFSTSALRVE